MKKNVISGVGRSAPSLGLLAIPALVILLAVSGFAQSTNARLDGTVQDQTGSIVPNAKVEALSNGTQARAQVTTDASGTFLFPNLAPGLYTLTVEASGFR